MGEKGTVRQTDKLTGNETEEQRRKYSQEDREREREYCNSEVESDCLKMVGEK